MRLISEQKEGKSDLVDVPTPKECIPPPRDVMSHRLVVHYIVYISDIHTSDEAD